jgi:hypothetical protein
MSRLLVLRVCREGCEDDVDLPDAVVSGLKGRVRSLEEVGVGGIARLIVLWLSDSVRRAS